MSFTKPIHSSSVFVVSGGARGVTAQCIIKLTQRYQCKSILLGRSSIEGVEPSWAKDCFDETELKKRIMDDFLSRGEKPKPVNIQKTLNQLLSRREIQKTLQAIAQAGGKADYLNVDVTDASMLQEKLAAAIDRLGPVTGIIHGAGNLADKFIERKTEQDFELVYAAKVKGLENLLRCIPASQLEHLVLFSSVAGFYGNAGQTDYAIANEILNKSAHLIKLHHPNCHAVSINWGPWDSGMVTAELKKAFAERNIDVIPLDVGAQMLVDELSNVYNPAAQVIIGSPIVPTAREVSSTLRTYRVHRKLMLETNPFLHDHVIGEHPVLPITCAASWIVNLCEQLYPGHVFYSLENFKVLKGIVFDRTQSSEFIVDIKEIDKSDTGEIVFDVVVWSENQQDAINLHYSSQIRIKTRLHYSSQIMIRKQAPSAPIYESFDPSQTYSLAGAALYQDGTLFHGKSFQSIERVLNISSQKLTLQCVAPHLLEEQQGQFTVETLNPYIADSLYQAILIWVRKFYQAGSLPLATEKLEYFRPIAAGERYYISLDLKAKQENSVVVDVTAHDDEGHVYIRLLDAQVTVDQRLNSLFEKSMSRYSVHN